LGVFAIIQSKVEQYRTLPKYCLGVRGKTTVFFKRHGGYGDFEVTGYRDLVIYSGFKNPKLITLCFLDEGVFQK